MLKYTFIHEVKIKGGVDNLKILKKLKRLALIKLNKFTSRSNNIEMDAQVSSKSKLRSNKLSLALGTISTLLLVVFIFILANKNLQAQIKIKEEPLNRLKELQREINAKEEQKKRLEQENLELNKEFEEARNMMIQNMKTESTELKSIISDYDFVLHFAGMKSFVGQGIRVTLADKEGIAYDSTTDSSEIVHDGDLRIIVEFFKSNYFDAIAVNGERISPMSPLLCTGPSVLVNRVYHSSPFVIEGGLEGIDNIEDFFKQLQDQQFIKAMKDRGLKLKIEIVKDMQLNPMQDDIYINSQVDRLGGYKNENK